MTRVQDQRSSWSKKPAQSNGNITQGKIFTFSYIMWGHKICRVIQDQSDRSDHDKLGN